MIAVGAVIGLGQPGLAAPPASPGGSPGGLGAATVAATEYGGSAVTGDQSGAHSVTVLPVYWDDPVPSTPTQATVTGAVRGAHTYFSTVSRGTISVALASFRSWTKVSLTDAQRAACDTGAVWDQVKASLGTAAANAHVAVVLPKTSTCAFTSLGVKGRTDTGWGLSFFNGTIDAAGLTNALGANMGLSRASARDCWVDAAHTAPVPLSSYCKDQPGGDPWDPMGSRPYGASGQLSATNLSQLGILDSTSFPELTLGQNQYAFLRPVGASGGQRGFAVTLGTDRFTVEYRTASGLDSWIDDRTASIDGTTRTDPGGGVIVRYQNLLAADPGETYVLDFHADGKVGAIGRHPGLEQGESWDAPGGVLHLDVLSAADSGASIKIEFPASGKVARWSGADRFATSAAISAASYQPGVPVVYIASGLVSTDALSGAPVAGMGGGPVLLVDKDTLPGPIQVELRRLQPSRIVVLGGENSVSPRVVDKLGSYISGPVERWSGSDRFSTSAFIAHQVFTPGVGTAYIASGRNYTDALSGAPVAGKNDSPVLLVDTDSIPDSIATELKELEPRRIVILGGEASVSAGVASQLADYTSGDVTRWSGSDRFATSAAIAKANYGPGVNVMYVASGRVFPDALSGAPVAGSTRGPILLVDTDQVPRVVGDQIKALQPRRIVILGGTSSVSEHVRTVLASYLP